MEAHESKAQLRATLDRLLDKYGEVPIEDDDSPEPLPDGVLPVAAVRPPAAGVRFMDVVFDAEGRFVQAVNPQGEVMNVGRWFERGLGKVWRVPFPPSEPVAGLMHNRSTNRAETTAARKGLGRGTSRWKVMNELRKAYRAGGDGLTDYELAELCALDKQTVGPRRVELMRNGWVEDSGIVRPNQRGNDSTVWTITDAGLARCDEGGFDE